MSVTLNPYLHFNDGKAEEVMNFYKGIFGGELSISRYGDFSGVPVEAEFKNLVMHSALMADHLQLMASDSGPMGNGTMGDNISLSLSGDDTEALTKYFEDLSHGGKVTQQLATQAWGDTFGMVTDKYGITWFVNITKPSN